MVKYEMRHQEDDETKEPTELVGSKDLRESFKDKDRIRGSFSINGYEFHQFEANSPGNVVALMNEKSDRSGVTASIDDKGHLVLLNSTADDIRVRLGRKYEEAAPQSTGDAAKDVLDNLKHEQRKQSEGDKNTILEDLGLDATEEDGDAEGTPRPGFETGLSADERKKQREEANPADATGTATGGTAGQGQTKNPTQIPSAPITGGAVDGKLDDGRGRTGDGTGYSARPDGGQAVPGTPANPGPQGANPADNSAPKQSQPQQ